MEKQIEIRRAKEKDIKKVMDLLSQVLEIHAKIRPDIFVSGKTRGTGTLAELVSLVAQVCKPLFFSPTRLHSNKDTKKA